MGRCSYDQLKNIEPALDQIRKLKNIKEPKPGIFYIKNQSFLHFHELDGKIWADIKIGSNWDDSVVVPEKITKKFLNAFTNIVICEYEKSGG